MNSTPLPMGQNCLEVSIRPQLAYQTRLTTASNLLSPSGLFDSTDAINPNAIGGAFVKTDQWRCEPFDKLGAFADIRGLTVTRDLLNHDLGEMFFTGGVCALSTRESTLAGRSKIEVDGKSLEVRGLDTTELSELLGLLTNEVTIAQVVETIGLSPRPGVVVLEDQLWSERMCSLLRVKKPEITEAVTRLVVGRNRQTFNAVNRLRRYVFGEDIEDLKPVSDRQLLPELKSRTDLMLRKLACPVDVTSDYRFVYAGMYFGVWREVLIEAGVQPDQLLTVIYEPTKHFAPEDRAEIAAFRKAIKAQEPFLQPGLNEKMALLSYWEPHDPNGRQFRKSVPTVLMPNASNFFTYDFSRFPVVPKSANKLPEINQFQFVEEIDSLKLERNPAYLWASVFPPTPTTQALMKTMERIRDDASRRNRETNGRDLLRSNSSDEMLQIAQDLIAELQKISSITFGGTQCF